MFKTLYVMRHGETDDNLAKIITAQADSPLTPRGRGQAIGKGQLLRRLVSDLSSLSFACSPLHRACVTMELTRSSAGIAPHPYETDPRLMEMAFGEWTKRREGDDRFDPGSPSAHEQWDLVPPGGESQAMVYERVGHFLQSITNDSVIVAHARVVCMLRSHLLKLSPKETLKCEPPNEGLLRLTSEGEAWLYP